MTICPVKTESGTPVVNDKGHLIPEIQLIQQPIKVFAVINEAVSAWTHVIKLVGVALTNEVRCNAPSFC